MGGDSYILWMLEVYIDQQAWKSEWYRYGRRQVGSTMFLSKLCKLYNAGSEFIIIIIISYLSSNLHFIPWLEPFLWPSIFSYVIVFWCRLKAVWQNAFTTFFYDRKQCLEVKYDFKEPILLHVCGILLGVLGLTVSFYPMEHLNTWFTVTMCKIISSLSGEKERW